MRKISRSLVKVLIIILIVFDTLAVENYLYFFSFFNWNIELLCKLINSIYLFLLFFRNFYFSVNFIFWIIFRNRLIIDFSPYYFINFHAIIKSEFILSLFLIIEPGLLFSFCKFILRFHQYIVKVLHVPFHHIVISQKLTHIKNILQQVLPFLLNFWLLLALFSMLMNKLAFLNRLLLAQRIHFLLKPDVLLLQSRSSFDVSVELIKNIQNSFVLRVRCNLGPFLIWWK